MVWDGAMVHRSKAIKTYLNNEAEDWLHLERLPPYAPELNPDEGIWNYLKNRELVNQCCKTLDELKTTVMKAMQKLEGKPEIIKACFNEAGL